MKNFDRRIKRLEEKTTAIVIQQFLKRMRNAKDDASKISIGWELLKYQPSLVRKFDFPTAEAFLDALPAGYSIAVRRDLSELAAKQTGDKE
jgi:hypothetical protein